MRNVICEVQHVGIKSQFQTWRSPILHSASLAIHTHIKMYYVTNIALSKILSDNGSKFKCKLIVNILNRLLFNGGFIKH